MRMLIGAFILMLGIPFFVLPGLGYSVYLSPDETATAVSADGFARLGTFRLSDPILSEFPWAHPRSFVSMGRDLVPVGFLGWPLLISIVRKMFGTGAMSFVTPLLALSVAFPLWSFFKSRGRPAQRSAVVLWLAFPTVILYANRGLFPNLPVVCFAVWASWFAWRAKNVWQFVVAGTLTGFALLIRPIEAIWILPWVAMAMHADWKTRSAKQYAGFLFPMILVCVMGAWFAYRTYGSPFLFGYLIRETAPSILMSTATNATPIASRIWPFGFHPRNVWWNIRGFLFGYLGPWTAIGLIGVAMAIKNRTNWKWIALGAWTALSLCLMYGQGTYFDNIQGNQLTLANSFMRYLLPLAAVVSVTAGFVASDLAQRWGRWGMRCVVFLLMLFIALGWWTAFIRDVEGLSANQLELQRYATIRANISRNVSSMAIVVSDRSDKIFFPSMRAISPMPSLAKLAAMSAVRPESMFVFIRTIDDEQTALWKKNGMALIPVLNAGNETLYLVE